MANPDRWLLLVAVQTKDWPGFAKAMNLPGLLDDPRFSDAKLRATNAAALVTLPDPVFASRSLAQWEKTLDEGRVIYGVVQIADEIIHDPQMLANGILVPLADDPTGSMRTVNSPVHVDGVPKVAPKRAPRLGEHSLDLLRELAFLDADIDRLCAAGAVSPESST